MVTLTNFWIENLSKEFSQNNYFLSIAAKIAIWQLQRDTLLNFGKTSIWERTWFVSDREGKLVLMTSTEKYTQKFMDHSSKILQTSSFYHSNRLSRNHWVPILTEFWYIKFLMSDRLDPKLISKFFIKCIRNMQVSLPESKYFLSISCLENRYLPVKLAKLGCYFLTVNRQCPPTAADGPDCT